MFFFLSSFFSLAGGARDANKRSVFSGKDVEIFVVFDLPFFVEEEMYFAVKDFTCSEGQENHQ